MLKFKSIPSSTDYRKFLAKVKPGSVKNRTGKVVKKTVNKRFYRSKSGSKRRRKKSTKRGRVGGNKIMENRKNVKKNA